MRNFRTNYYKILEVLDQVELKYDFLKQIRKPRLIDKEMTDCRIYESRLSIKRFTNCFEGKKFDIYTCSQRFRFMHVSWIKKLVMTSINLEID